VLSRYNGPPVERLRTIVAEYRTQALDDSARFMALHEEFVRTLAAWDRDHGQSFVADGLTAEADFSMACQRRYLGLREAEAADMLLSTSAGASSPAAILATPFARASYERVRDIETLLDLSRCRRAAMIGCGAFPATALWLRDHYPLLECLCVDIDGRSVALAHRLVEKFAFTGLVMREADGCAIDYGGFDFVYVANQVTPKARVLERLATTANAGVRVVVRNPYGVGLLLAECVRTALPERFVVRAEGTRSPGFLSVDLVLGAADA
jgi:hypothetical protein